MLIVAMPKTASTSLMKTLGQLHDIPVQQRAFPARAVPDEYHVLPSFHSDMRQIDQEIARSFADEGRLFKQHILPTDGNRRLLRDVRKVLLLRDPFEVVLAYRRGVLAATVAPRDVFAGCDSEAEWLRRSEESGLTADLQRFHAEWANDDGHTLIIEYTHLILDPTKQIRRVEAYFGWKTSRGPVKLRRDRYSRSPISNLLRRIGVLQMMFQMARRIKRRLRAGRRVA